MEEESLRYPALEKLEVARSTINIKATTDLFKSGKIKLRCSATMFTLYKFVKETEILEDAPQLALIREQTTPANEGKKGRPAGPSSIVAHFIRLLLLINLSLLF